MVVALTVRSADSKREEPQDQTEPPGPPLTPKALIDALIDIDLAYERMCQQLSNSPLGATLQYHRLGKLQEQHRERREPYVRQLMALQDERKARSGS
jgi:hypothetical protein